jgi:hypothetical protein
MKPRHRRDLPDAQLIRMIAARVLDAPLTVRPSRVDLRAAIAAAHAAQPFDLRALLNAPDYTFFDRIHGIQGAAARGQPEAATERAA